MPVYESAFIVAMLIIDLVDVHIFLRWPVAGGRWLLDDYIS